MHGSVARNAFTLLYSRHHLQLQNCVHLASLQLCSLNTKASAGSRPGLVPCPSANTPLIPRLAELPQAKRSLSGDPVPLQMLISFLGLDGSWVPIGRVGAAEPVQPDFAEVGKSFEEVQIVGGCGGRYCR